MPTHMEYASPQTAARRWSKRAIFACAVSVGDPLLMVILIWASDRGLVPYWVLGNMGWVSLLSVVFGPLAVTVVAALWPEADGEPKGTWLLIPAFLASIAWPTFCFYYALSHLPNC